MAKCEEWVSPFAESSLPVSNFDFAATSKCTYLEMLRYPGDPRLFESHGELQDESLSRWLSKDLNQPRSSAEAMLSNLTTIPVAPSGGLRLLFGVCGFNPEKNLEKSYGKTCTVVPLTAESFAALEDKLGLPENFLRIMGEPSGHKAFKVSQRLDDRHLSCYIFRFTMNRPSFYHLALSYNYQTKLTHGLLIAKSRTHEFAKLIQGLKDRQNHCEQPLVLAALIAELVIERCSQRVNICDSILNDLEERMGQHQYLNRPRGNPLEVDFESTSCKISFQNRKLGLDTARLQGVLLTLKIVIEETRKFEEQGKLFSTASGTTISSLATSDSFCMVDEMVSYLFNVCQNTLARLEYETKRTQNLKAVNDQFMAQKDSKVAIQLAEISSILARASKEDSEAMRVISLESKKDTSSMKTIAVLTIFFLPGTFLAAVFALPFFNWDGDGIPTVKTGFKYYLAVAVPLTLLVLILWALTTLLPWRRWLSKNELHSSQSIHELKPKSYSS